MPSNPMQKKVRNSFFLGILVMLIIVIAIAACVFFLIVKPKLEEKKEEEEQLYANVYRLKMGQSIESGERIDLSMLEIVEIPVNDTTTDFLTETTDVDNYRSKIDLKSGTLLTKSMFYEEDEEEIEKTLRYVEYNMITMPIELEVGDFVDIRLRITNAQDFIIISKKEIVSINDETVGFYLNEEEILLLNSAIVEAYILTGSDIYVATYVEPGMQEASTYTYTPTTEVINLIYNNENIVQEAKNELVDRYNHSAIRSNIESAKSQYTAEEQNGSVESRMEEQIQAAREAREKYLSGLEQDY